MFTFLGFTIKELVATLTAKPLSPGPGHLSKGLDPTFVYAPFGTILFFGVAIHKDEFVPG